MKKILLLFLLCYSAGAHAQHSKTEMERFLTNGELRTWIYKNYKVTLGTSCSGDGQSFDFYKKGSLVIWKRCLDGVPRVDSLKWQIIPVSNSPGEFYIKLSKEITMFDGLAFNKMLLNLPNPAIMARNKEMLWNKAPDCKTCPDAILKFESRN